MLHSLAFSLLTLQILVRYPSEYNPIVKLMQLNLISGRLVAREDAFGTA